MTELLVRPALPLLDEAESFQQSDDHSGLEDGQAAHGSADSDELRTDEMTLQLRVAVLEKHGDDLVPL